MDNLTIDEITGIAMAGIRGINLLAAAAKIANALTDAADAADKLDSALVAANAAAVDGETIPEDFTVLNAAKAFGKAEQKVLFAMHTYLSFAKDYDYSSLFTAEEERDLFDGLLPKNA